jgi:hypothetical protein
MTNRALLIFYAHFEDNKMVYRCSRIMIIVAIRNFLFRISSERISNGKRSGTDLEPNILMKLIRIDWLFLMFDMQIIVT